MSNPTPLSDELNDLNRMLDAYDEEERTREEAERFRVDASDEEEEYFRVDAYDEEERTGEEAERVRKIVDEVDSVGLPKKLGDGLRGP